MNKLINLYIFLILIISLILIFNVNFYSVYFTLIPNNPFIHKLFEYLIIFVFILIILKTNKLYSQTKDKRFAIIAGSFLTRGFLGLFDLIFIHTLILELKPSLLYNLAEKLVIPISIFIAIFYTEKSSEKISERKSFQYRCKIYFLYLFIALLTIVLTQINFSLLFKSTFSLLEQSLVIADETFYFLTALVLADQRLISNKNIFSIFILGLLTLGISQLFYIYSLSTPINGDISLFMKLIGFLFLYFGIKDLQLLPKTVKLRQKLLIYMAGLLIMSYLIFSLFILLILKIDLPKNFPFIFLVFLFFSIAIEYIISAEFTSPISRIIRVVNNYRPEKKSEKIKIKSNDEIGELSEKLNNIIEKNWDYTQELLTNEKKIIEFLNKEQLLFKITNTIRSSLDLDEILTIICEETSKLFKAQRAVISEITDINNPEYFIIVREYKFDKSVKGALDAKKVNEEYFKELGRFWAENMIKPGKILAIDNIQESDSSDFFKEIYNYMGVKSIIGIPITTFGNKSWALYLSEYNYYRHWTDEEKKLLETISHQIYIAIKQADLYSTTKKQYEREDLLRKVTESIRSSLNINKIKNIFVTDVGKLLDADRTFISIFDDENNIFKPVDKDSEYLRSPDIRSNIGEDIEKYKFYVDILRKKNEIIVQNAEEFIEQHKLKDLNFTDYIIENNVKSGIGFPILYGDELLGILSVQFTRDYYIFTKEELDFLRMLTDQAGIAIYQAELYESQKQTAEKEKLLRSINNDILENENIIDASEDIVNDIGKLFNVDRINLRLFDPETSTFSEVYGEYRKEESLPTARGKKIPQIEVNQFLVQELYEKKQALNINIEDPDCNELFKIGMEFFNAKSSVIIPIFYKDDLIAAIFVSNIITEKIWSKEELEFLIIIIQQLAIAINLFRNLNTEK